MITTHGTVNVSEIAALLAERAEEFCRHFLPKGRKIGDTWRCGNIDGDEGTSMSVTLSGQKAGKWNDFATGEHGDLLDLIEIKTGCSKHDAVEEAKRWLDVDGTSSPGNRKTSAERKADNEKHLIAADEAAKIYERSMPCERHEYLSKKNVPACHGLRVNAAGSIVVPLTDLETGDIKTIQFILKEPLPDGRDKNFLKGGATGGSSFLITEDGTDSPDDALLFCEGLATGLSIMKGVGRGFSVLMCVDAGNMFPVALKARRKWPERSFIFCADNDARDKKGNPRKGEANVGVSAARRCAKAVGGTVVVPEAIEGQSTDWNDFANHLSKEIFPDGLGAEECADAKANFETRMCALLFCEDERYPIPSPQEHPVRNVEHVAHDAIYCAKSPLGEVKAKMKDVRYAVEHHENGCAYLYASMFKDRLLFDTASRSWYVFEEHRWRPDFLDTWRRCFSSVSDVVRKAVEPQERKKSDLKKLIAENTQESMNLAAESFDDPEEHSRRDKELSKEAKRLTSALNKLDKATKEYDETLHNLDSLSFRNNSAELSHGGRDSLGYDGCGWDREPYILPCRNGVLDLRTGTLRDGSPSDRFLTGTELSYDADAQCPTWNAFLESCFPGKPKMVAYLKRLTGYAACRDPNEQIFAIFTGTGGNGKGVFVDAIMKVLGGAKGVACVLQPEMLMDTGRQHASGQARADLMSLRGKAIAVASEANAGGTFNSAVVKRLTGQDPITARPPFGVREITFMPTHVLVFLTNALPRIDAGDSAMWRRVHLVRFEQDFTSNPDKELKRKLEKEYPGILRWIVEGAMEWRRDGLNPPDEVTAATEEYREDMDVLADFFASEVDYIKDDGRLSAAMERFQEGSYTRRKDLFGAYCIWARLNGFHPYTRKGFGLAMSTRRDVEIERDRHTKSEIYKLKEPLKVALPYV